MEIRTKKDQYGDGFSVFFCGQRTHPENSATDAGISTSGHGPEFHPFPRLNSVD